MRTFLTLAAIFILSCNQGTPNIDKAKAINAIKESLILEGVKDSSLKVVDTIHIISIENVSPKLDSLYVKSRIEYKLFIDSMINSSVDTSELKSDIARYKDDYVTYGIVKFLEEDLDKYRKHLEYKKVFAPRLERIKQLLDKHAIDSTPQKGWVVTFKYVGADYNNKEKIGDSLWMFLNEHYRIMLHDYYDDTQYQVN